MGLDLRASWLENLPRRGVIPHVRAQARERVMGS